VDRALQPGMRLMRRISITGKFGVFLLLLLLPLTIGVGSGYAESTGLLRSAQREQAGLRLATPLVQLVVQVAQAQDSAARGIAPPRRLTAVDDVEAAMRGVPADADALLRLAGYWRQTRAGVEDLTAQTRPEDAAARAGVVMDHCLDLLQRVSDVSGLTDDPELGTHYLLDGLILTLPRLMQSAGSAGAAQQPGTTAQDLRLQHGMATRSLRILSDRLALELSTSGTHTDGGALHAGPDPGAVRAAVAQYAAAPADGAVTPLGSGTLAAASAALATQLSGVVDGLLGHRQEQLASSRNRPVLLALGSLLVLGYLLVAVTRATSQDVHAVLEDISTVTNGEQPREDLPSGSDEFARMSRAVTITRDRLTALLGSLR
jgi:hypothetical protein